MKVPESVVGIRLYRIVREEAVACEAVRFDGGAPVVDMMLRRAAISGRVEIGGTIKNHFADLLDEIGDLVETVELDAKSYHALKTRWLRCKLEPTS